MTADVFLAVADVAQTVLVVATAIGVGIGLFRVVAETPPWGSDR